MPYREGDDARRVHLRLVENLTVETPCRENWNRMQGDERVRHCSRCDKDVFNLSAMSLEQLAILVEEMQGNLRAQFYRRPDARLVAGYCPSTDTARLASRIAGAGVAAAGVVTAATLIATAPAPAPEPDDEIHIFCDGAPMLITAREPRAPEDLEPAEPGLVAKIANASRAPGDARNASIADLASVGELAPSPPIPRWLYEHTCSRLNPAGSFEDAEIEAFAIGEPEPIGSFGWGIRGYRRWAPEPCPIKHENDSRDESED